VIINLTKVERGERLQQVEVDQLTRLRNLVQELVPAGKLIFPRSDREEEYVAKRLDAEIHRDFLGLSLGINMRHRQSIFDWQAQLGMEANGKNDDTVTGGVDAYFQSDPVEELDKDRQRNMVIGAHPMRIPEILARREAANVQVLESWEMQQLLDPERLPQHRDVLQGLRSFLGASLGSEVIIAVP
jgi:hypothetical protein